MIGTARACVCVYVHTCALTLADRLEGLGTSLDKQTLCLAHLFTSSSHNYRCSLRNHSDNQSMVPSKQKFLVVKQLIGQCGLFTSLLSWCRFAQISVCFLAKCMAWCD